MLKYIIGILLAPTTLVTSSKAQTTATFERLGDVHVLRLPLAQLLVIFLPTQHSEQVQLQLQLTVNNTRHYGIHTHGNFNFTYPSGADTSGGVLAFEGDSADNVSRAKSLVAGSHLTKSQINEGFASTQSADVWFWNNIENTLTLKQTITRM